jgi:hypothetical protein
MENMESANSNTSSSSPVSLIQTSRHHPDHQHNPDHHQHHPQACVDNTMSGYPALELASSTTRHPKVIIGSNNSLSGNPGLLLAAIHPELDLESGKSASTSNNIDLFAVPHTRMRDLVSWPLSEAAMATDVQDLEPCLQAVYEAMWELKTHEYIENNYIMNRLKARLQTKRVCELIEFRLG